MLELQRRIMTVLVMCIAPLHLLAAEKDISGWALYIDNDLFSTRNTDRDYTGGAAWKLSGSDMQFDWLDGLDRWTGFDTFFTDYPELTTHSREIGFTLFTPDALTISRPRPELHPYASLFFVSYSRIAVHPENFRSYQSGLMLGMLGLPLGGDIQGFIHDLTGGDEPGGWDNQISEGGELTAKYMLSASKTYPFSLEDGHRLEIIATKEMNLGFTTDVGASVSLRFGSIYSPWWTFNPHNAEYISLGSPAVPEAGQEGMESYFWMGANIKYRLYNAILQGQFRDSKVTFDRDQLNPWIAELWIGYTHELDDHWQISGFIRGRSKEIDLTTMSAPVWGGFIFSRYF